MQVSKINWAGLLVENFNDALNFFKQTLGLPMENLYAEKQIAQFRLPSGQLFELFGPKNRKRKEKYKFFKGIALGFEVSNLDEVNKKLKDNKVKYITDVESSSHDSWSMFLGPENNVLQVQQSKSTGFKNIAYICLYVSNMAETVYFYRNILGLEPLNPKENPETSHWYAFKTGQTILAIERHGVKKTSLKTKAENPYLLQFIAETPEAFELFNQKLEKHKVKLLDRSKRTNYGTITNFYDPDGNKIEVIYQN